MREGAGAWTRTKEAIRSRFIKEKPPEVVDSIKGEDIVDFEFRLEKMAKKEGVVGVYHHRDTGIIFTVPRGTNREEIHRIYIRQVGEIEDRHTELRRAHEDKKDAPAHVEPPKLLEDMTDNVVDIDGFMSSLDTLDFKDVGKVLEWCISFGESRSRDNMHLFKEEYLQIC